MNRRQLAFQASALTELSYRSIWYWRLESDQRQMAYKTIPITTWVLQHIVYTSLTTRVPPSCFIRLSLVRQLYIGGQGWIRTTEVADSGFTVRPIWPLWNLPMLRAVGFEPTISTSSLLRPLAYALILNSFRLVSPISALVKTKKPNVSIERTYTPTLTTKQ